MTKRTRFPKPTTTADSSTDPLLYSREQVAKMLGGICVMTVIRLQQKGRLKPIKLDKTGRRIFYRREDVLALAQAKGGAQ